jgi:hypothetical protein
MRFRVLLEIEAPDPGTPIPEGGTTASPEKWVWQDFFNRLKPDRASGITVKEAIIILPGFCGNCGEQVTFFDYLCGVCRTRSMPGTPQYDNG